MYHEEDDDFFPTSTNSNLASLFGNAHTDNNTSLTYVAPKQPKSVSNLDQTNEPSGKRQAAVVCAKPVDLYKIVKSSYNLIGKYGLALIGSTDQITYEIILYKDNQNIFLRIKLTSKFSLICQANVYASFMDDSNQMWTVKFVNNTDLNNFAAELQKRKFHVVRQVSTNKNSPTTKESPDVNKSDLDKLKETVNEDPDINHINSNAKTKADILSRIVKMGQKALPVAQKEMSDSESDTSESLDLNTKQCNLNEKSSTEVPQNATQIVPVQNLSYSQNDAMQYNNLQVFFAENRTHNSEIRMNISQLSSKFDSITKDLQMLKSNENESLRNKIELLETKISALDVKMFQKNHESHEIINDKSLERLENKIEELIKSNTILKNEIQHLQEQHIPNESSIPKPQDYNYVIGIIKASMNDMYQNISKHLTEETYTNGEIKKVLAKNIKIETLELVQKLEALNIK